MSQVPHREGIVRQEVRDLCIEITQLLKSNSRLVVRSSSDADDLGLPFTDLDQAFQHYLTSARTARRIEAVTGYLDLRGHVFRPSVDIVLSESSPQQTIDYARYRHRKLTRDRITSMVYEAVRHYNEDEMLLVSDVLSELLVSNKIAESVDR
jgi:hypothetical protein